MLAVLALIAIAEPPVIDRLIPFDAERTELTLAYRRLHEDPTARSIQIAPRLIVLHHTATPTLEATLATFRGNRLPAARRELRKGGALNVAAHFVIDRDGAIYRLVPETTLARHAIGFNHLAIGIENVGGTPETPLTPAQVRANAELVRALVQRHAEITHLVGHHELARMSKHRYRVERVTGYATVKVDPGDRFMAEVRARVADLGLAGAR